MNSSGPVTFATLLRCHRQEAGLTQEQLAEQAGLSLRAVSDLERGVKLRPHRTTVQLLAGALGLAGERRRQFEGVAQTSGAGLAPSPAAALSVPGPGTRTTGPGARRHNLPFPTSSFVGRRPQLEQLRRLLWKAGVRLVTLTGAGGSGKTRLALELAASLLDDFADGVYFVNLALLTHPAEVGPTLATTLGLRQTPDRPLLQTLKDFLCEQRMLLLLDNFEHLLDAAPLVTELLEAAGALKVLVTSRISLQLGGEQQYQVPPLDLPRPGPAPTVEQLGQYEAVQLFGERARAVGPAFQIANENAVAVAEICRRLDGLPLAIELAAARMQMLTPQALLAGLEPRLTLLTGGRRDVPARQQTLRAAIAWSYDLLEPAERQLFRRLAVFAGGSTLEQIAAVCNAGGDLQVDVLNGVQSLLNKSLLGQEEVEVAAGPGEPRFAMLETIREYARERLQGSGEAEVLAREHALYFMRLVEAEEPEVTEAWRAEGLARLDVEYENIRAALRWARAAKGSRAETADAISIGLRIAGAMWRFWDVRGYCTEASEHLDALLALDAAATAAEVTSGAAPRRRYRAKALHGAGAMAMWQQHPGAARERFEERLAIEREVGDKAGMAAALADLGTLCFWQGESTAARSALEESLARASQIGDRQGIARARFFLGMLACGQGDYAAGHGLIEASLVAARELGYPWAVGYLLIYLGQQSAREGDYAGARAKIEEGLALSREVGNKNGIAAGLAGLGTVACAQGAYAAARPLIEESLAIWQELGDKGGIAWGLLQRGLVAYGQGDYTAARSLTEESLALSRETGLRLRIASALNDLALFAYTQGDAGRARRLIEESLALLRETDDRWIIATALTYAAALALASRAGEISAGRIAVAELAAAERGARLLGAAEALCASSGIKLEAHNQRIYERAGADARAHLGEAAMARAREQGRAMSVQQAIEYALEHEAARQAPAV